MPDPPVIVRAEVALKARVEGVAFAVKSAACARSPDMAETLPEAALSPMLFVAITEQLYRVRGTSGEMVIGLVVDEPTTADPPNVGVQVAV